MSLTREQWIELWNSIKVIESMTAQITTSHVKARIIKEIRYIKSEIQSVIGQME